MYTVSVINDIISRLGAFCHQCLRYNLPELLDQINTEDCGHIVDIDLWTLKRTTVLVTGYQGLPEFKVLFRQHVNKSRTLGIKEAFDYMRNGDERLQVTGSLDEALELSGLDRKLRLVLDDIDLILRNKVSQECTRPGVQQVFDIRYAAAPGDEGYVAIFVKSEQTAVVVQLKNKTI